SVPFLTRGFRLPHWAVVVLRRQIAWRDFPLEKRSRERPHVHLPHAAQAFAESPQAAESRRHQASGDFEIRELRGHHHAVGLRVFCAIFCATRPTLSNPFCICVRSTST